MREMLASYPRTDAVLVTRGPKRHHYLPDVISEEYRPYEVRGRAHAEDPRVARELRQILKLCPAD